MNTMTTNNGRIISSELRAKALEYAYRFVQLQIDDPANCTSVRNEVWGSVDWSENETESWQVAHCFECHLELGGAVSEMMFALAVWAGVKPAQSKRQERRIDKDSGSELLYEEEGFVVREVINARAVKLFSKGTKWCISDGGEYWKSYIREGVRFFLVEVCGTKYMACRHESSLRWEVYDELDKKWELKDIMSFGQEVLFRGIVRKEYPRFV